MRTTFPTHVFVLLLALLPVAAMPLLGAWVLAISALLLCLLLVQIGPDWSRRLVLLVGATGGIIGAITAGAALLTVGGEPVSSTRVGFGWSALLLAIVAAGGGLLATRRPGAGGAVMLLAGLAGTALITLFSINTVYVLAMGCWLVGAVLAFRQPGRQPVSHHVLPR